MNKNETKKKRKLPKITAKKLERKCKAECYEYFANQKSITRQQAAGLLSGYFFKPNEPIKTPKTKIKLAESRIDTAIKTGYITKLNRNRPINDNISLDTITFFNWAIKAYIGLYDALPSSVQQSHIFTTPGTFNNNSSARKEVLFIKEKDVDINKLIIENDKLTSEKVYLVNKIKELEENNMGLEKEIKVLRPLAQLGIKFKENQSKKGKSKKNYHY